MPVSNVVVPISGDKEVYDCARCGAVTDVVVGDRDVTLDLPFILCGDCLAEVQGDTPADE